MDVCSWLGGNVRRLDLGHLVPHQQEHLDVLFTAGAALNCLGVCYWLIDCCGWKRWAKPAVVFGMNAIAVYVISGIVTDLTIVVKVGSVPLKQWLYETL